MWLLNYLPDWFFNAVAILGVAGLLASHFLKYVSFVILYRVPLQIISIILTVVGVWFSGAHSNELRWKAKVKELENLVFLAEERARNTNARIEYVFIDRVKTVKDVQVILQEKIVTVAQQIDSVCTVTPDTIDIHNAAVKNKNTTGALK